MSEKTAVGKSVPSNVLLEHVEVWLSTWGPHCGAPRTVFEGQFHALLRKIFDEIESRAEANMMKTHKLEGMHYAALKDVRKELGVCRSNNDALRQRGVKGTDERT